MYLYHIQRRVPRELTRKENTRDCARGKAIDSRGITVKSSEFKEKNEGTKSGRCETVLLAKRGGI